MGYRGLLQLIAHEYSTSGNVRRLRPAELTAASITEPPVISLPDALLVARGVTSYFGSVSLLPAWRTAAARPTPLKEFWRRSQPLPG